MWVLLPCTGSCVVCCKLYVYSVSAFLPGLAQNDQNTHTHWHKYAKVKAIIKSSFRNNSLAYKNDLSSNLSSLARCNDIQKTSLRPLRWCCCHCCCNNKDQRNGHKRSVRHRGTLRNQGSKDSAWFTEDDDHEPSEDNNHDDGFSFHFGTLDNIDDLEHEGDAVWRMDVETGSEEHGVTMHVNHPEKDE